MRRPVFVDHTGRRRRAAIIVGSGLGVLLVLGLIMMAVGMLSGGSVPLPGWPDNARNAEPLPSPTPVVQPAQSRGPGGSTTPGGPGSTVAPSPTGPGNGNGNGHGGRPSKPPGKP